MSKNSMYFKDVQSAREYFPNGVPSNVLAIVGDGLQVLVSSDNMGSANQEYYSSAMTNDEIVQARVEASYSAGEDAGYTDGYATGHTAGYSEGYSYGYSYGYDIGYDEGEQSGSGSSEPTIGELNNMSLGLVLMSLYTTGTQSLITMEPADLDYLDAEVAKAAMNATSLQFTVDKYNETNGLTIDNNATFDTDNTTYMKVQIALNAGDKVGFSLTPANTDAETGDYLFEHPCNWLWRHVDPNNTGLGYITHWFDAQNTGDYEFEITLGSDPETGDSTVEGYAFTEVVLP